MIDPATLAAQRAVVAARTEREALLARSLATAARAAELGLEPLGAVRLSHVEPLVGRRFGRVEVLGLAGRKRRPNGRTKLHWLCRCDCGKEFASDGCHIREGQVTQCAPCCYAAAAERERAKARARREQIARAA